MVLTRSAIFLAFLAFAAPASRADGSLAPLLDRSFEFLDGGHSTLRNQLAGDGTLVLLVWNTDCSVCLENVAQADGLDASAIGARLLGVNFDASRYDALAVVEDRALRVPQFHDPDGLVAEAIGSLGESFSFVLLDGAGLIKAQRIGSVPDAAVAIRRSLLESARDRFPEPSAWRPAREREHVPPPASGEQSDSPTLRLKGETRIRLLGVGTAGSAAPDTCGCGLAGAYGEELRSVKDLLFRVTLEPELRLDGGIRVGARLRMSNEDPRFLETGPQYLSSERGSVYAELRRGETTIRLGYDDWHFTPLTMQRWDFADNPPASGSGGTGGCGACGGAVRAVSLEALDRLGADVTLEGAHLRSSPVRWLRVEGHYGRVARPAAWSPFDPDAFAYRRDLFGARVSLSRGIAGKRVALSGNYVAVRDDPASSQWVGSAHDPSGFLYRNEVYSGDLALGLPAGFALTGEAAHSNRREDRVDARMESDSDWGALFEVSRTVSGSSRFAIAWLRLGGGYEAAFQALTYQANLSGFRASAEFDGARKHLGLFAKILDRVDDAAPGPKRRRVFGGLIGLSTDGGLVLDVAMSHTRETNTGSCECGLSNFAITGLFPLGKDVRLRCELSKVFGERVGSADPAKGDIGILELDVDF